jgi:non-heme chloroperoxidase
MGHLESHDGTTLFYRDWGEGAPVVFCSAWSLSSVQWKHYMALAAERGLRAVAYDRRGHGRSDDPGRGYDLDTLADDLAALIELLDLHDATLVGHSMGGGEIVRYLSRHGTARIARVTLVAATLPCALASPDNPRGLAPELFEAVREHWRADFEGWMAENEPAYFGDGLPGCDVGELARRWTSADMLDVSLHAAIEFNRASVEADFRDELRALELPVLIVHGDRDASAPIELCGRRQADLLPDCRLITYENAPHALYITHRERLTRDLGTFIVGGLAAVEDAAPPVVAAAA